MYDDDESTEIRRIFESERPAGADEEADGGEAEASAGNAGDGGGDAAGDGEGEGAGGPKGAGADEAAAPTALLALRRPAGGGRVRFPELSPRAYEHPADAAALATLRKLTGFDTLARKVMGALGERRLRYWFLAGAVRANERQLRDVYAVYAECCEILDLPRRPDLFVMQTPVVNAGALGTDEPFVVLASSALDLFDRDELRFILGHELGHILSGHALYKSMLAFLLQLSLVRLAYATPISGLALWAIIAALREWDRKSELSADRAGLLCVQDPRVACTAQMKMAGGAHVDQMSVDELLAQAEEYESGGDIRDSALKLLNLLSRTHPFPVVRLAELKRWADGGEYERILAGDYPRRGADGRPMHEDLGEAARHYRSAWSDSKDPLARLLNDLGESVGQAGAALWDQVRELFTKRPPDKDDA